MGHIPTNNLNNSDKDWVKCNIVMTKYVGKNRTFVSKFMQKWISYGHKITRKNDLDIDMELQFGSYDGNT